MADGNQDSEPALPPKLDLRKSGILKPTAKDDAATGDATKEEAVQPEAVADSGETADITVEAEKASRSEPAVKPVETPEPAAEPAVAAAGEQVAPAADLASGKPADITADADNAERPTPVAAARPVTVKAIPVQDASAPPQTGGKRATTQIALDAAKPKSIKAIPKPVTAGETAAVPSIPKPEGMDEHQKRSTSRISLESVLGEEEGGAAPGAPKTIRLKRPGAGGAPKVVTQAKTVKAVKRPAPDGQEAAAAVDTDAASEEKSQTRKKTVVVRKPQAGAAKKLKISRPDAEAAAQADAPAAAAAIAAPIQRGADQPGVFFSIVAIAATLVALATIYMFTAQVIGPNYSMTEYSYVKDGPDLVWPSKLSHR